jgi:hypothetical protein
LLPAFAGLGAVVYCALRRRGELRQIARSENGERGGSSVLGVAIDESKSAVAQPDQDSVALKELREAVSRWEGWITAIAALGAAPLAGAALVGLLRP